MDGLRPCIVRIPEKREMLRDVMSGNIKRVTVQEAEEHKGYFHKWSDRFWTIGESPMVGGYAAGQMSQTVAIVEYEDGTVHEHYPLEIRFTDRNEP